MNKKTTIALFAALPLLWGCTTEHDFRTPASEGDEAVFVVGTNATRTMYANDQWDGVDNKQELYWGNYNSVDTKENIRVFCSQAGRKMGTYEIELKADPEQAQGSPVAGAVTRVGDAGVQWGAEGTAHTFYAFYPAELAGEALTGESTISATILPGQSPKAFRAVVANGTVYGDTKADMATSLTQVAANSTKNTANRTDIFCQPDMENALMVARTDMPASQYGQDVPLDFNVIADVLDITVNGPVIPNQLGGNSAGQSRDYINVYDVSVVHKDGKPIVGTFDLNMANSTATNIRNGSDRILIQLAQTQADGKTRQVPTLFARADKNTGETVNAATEVDHLRVRAFLAPGVVKNLNELQILVSTDCGDYTQDLGDYTITQAGGKPNGTGNASDPTMVAGKIHRLKLGYFMERGKSFDYKQWMSQLDPTIFINELSIPGSWHSTDSKYQGSVIRIVDQYEHGLRAFETHAKCSLADPTLTGQTAGTPQISSRSSTGNISVTAEDANKQAAEGATRRMQRTVTYTATITTPITATISKANYKVLNTADNSMFDGLTALGAAILDSEFAIVEIGDEGSSDIDEPVVGSTATATRTETKTITKIQYGTQSCTKGPVTETWYWGSWNNSQSNITWENADPTQAEWIAAPATSSNTSGFTYTQTRKMNSFVGGVSWLINELKNASDSKLYTAGVTPSTTLGDVKGHFIIKVNTNQAKANGDNNNEVGWASNIPALFSRWEDNSEDNINTVALKWGGPIDPATSNPSMKWVFSEKDQVWNIENRKTAWGKFVDDSFNAYQDKAHNSWFEFSAGGYDANTGQSAQGCQTLAKELNPWLLNKITDPTRQACPLGLVFFNYAVDPSNTYSSESLIRTIINNNGAFALRRLEPQKVGEQTNSYFRRNNNNPIR